ncbi:MAG: methionine synthase [Eubacteriales bacterium]
MQTYSYPLILKKPTQRAVLRRLGYHKQTVVESDDMAKIDGMMARAADICRPKAKAVLLAITAHSEKSTTLENGLVLQSAKLAKMLAGANQALVMGATLATSVTDIINQELKSGDAVFGVVLDAYASECVDDSLDFVMQAQARNNFRTGQMLTRHRFSAGYGDLDLSYQKDLFDLLKMDELGVSINENFLMEPEKSVIAICGVEG